MAYVEFDGSLDGESSSGFVPFTGELDKPKGVLERIKGALNPPVAAAEDSSGAVDPMTGIDPTGGQAIAETDPQGVGIMADAKVDPNFRKQTSPFRPEVARAIENRYDAAAPEERADMLVRPSAAGDVVRRRDAQFVEMDASAPLDNPLDPRAEARSRRLAKDGMAPELAGPWGAEGARRGELPGTEVGTVTSKDVFDFDTQKKFNEDPFFKNPLVRGAVKGYEGYKQGIIGLNEFLADTVGADDAAAGFRKMGKQSTDFTTAMGEPKNYTQSMFEGAVSSISQQLPALIGGVVTGSEPAVLSAMFVQSYGQQYAEGRAAGQSIGEATTRASQMAAFEVIGEKLGLGQQLAGIKAAARGNVDQAVNMLAKAAIREVPGEELTTVGQFAVDKEGGGVGIHTEAGAADLFKQMVDTFSQTVIQGGLMTGGGKAVATAVNKFNTPERQIAREIDNTTLNNGDTGDIARAALDPQNRNAIPAQQTVRAPQATIADIQSATTVDDAIAAATAVVNEPVTMPAAPVLQLSDQQQLIAELEAQSGLTAEADVSQQTIPASADYAPNAMQLAMQQAQRKLLLTPVSQRAANTPASTPETPQEPSNAPTYRALHESIPLDPVAPAAPVQPDSAPGRAPDAQLAQSGTTDPAAPGSVAGRDPAAGGGTGQPQPALTPVVSFKTAKGSTYKVEGNATIRDKAARPEHPGESGIQPKSDVTVYVSKADADRLGEVQSKGGGRKEIAALGDGRYGMRYLDGKDAGKFEQRTVITPKTEPAVGLIPVEITAGYTPHFGNEITEVSTNKSEDIAGDKINKEWTAFDQASGTLGIPRAEMPQIKAEHRGALVNFLNARGITHEQGEVDPSTLKPTQLEFSQSKVNKAKGFTGTDRSILVSADWHVLDGHHQWLAKRESGEPVKVIRLNAPIKKLLAEVAEFPSAEVAGGATPAGVQSADSGGGINNEKTAALGRQSSAEPGVPASANGEKQSSARNAGSDRPAIPDIRPERAQANAGDGNVGRSGSDLPAPDSVQASAQEVAQPAEQNDNAVTKEEAADMIAQSDMPTAEQIKINALLRKGDVTPADVMAVLQPSEKPAANIVDFGEKIAGAKKELWQDYKNRMAEELPDDAADITLSKHFPEPNYEALINEGVDVTVLAAIKAMRDEIPSKPRRAYKLSGWVDNLRALRTLSNSLITGKNDIFKVMDLMRSPEFRLTKFADRIQMYADLGYPTFKRAADYKIDSGAYSYFESKEYKPPITKFEIVKSGRTVAYCDGYLDALEALRARLTAETESPGDKRETKLDIYRLSGGDIIIGKKIAAGKFIDLKGGFTTARDARAYHEQHKAELLALLEKKKEVRPERRSVNDPRIGIDRRLGEDIAPATFAETFGFRGVQFGNYVEQSRRAKDLNNAYDALLDLADTINVPARALSLNGELGLAFGARGSGGKNAFAAHYEAGHVVINLTKSSGAGSLGHEWFHALDNYFSRLRGDSAGFITNSPRPKRVYGPDRTFIPDASIRSEVLDAFNGIVTAIKSSGMLKRSQQLDSRRTKDYWSTSLEMAARAFESYVIDKAKEQGRSNDYLANILGEDAHNAMNDMMGDSEPFAYPTRDEAPVINAAFDKLFATLQTKETDKGVALFFRPGTNPVDFAVKSGIIPVVTFRTTEVFKSKSHANLYRIKNHLADTAAVEVAGGWSIEPKAGPLTAAEQKETRTDVAALNRVLKANGQPEVLPLLAVPSAHHELARRLGKIFGTRVQFVSNNDAFDGVAVNGVAYLTKDMKRPELAIAGHEVFHTLEQTNPAMAEDLLDHVRGYLQEGVIEARQQRESLLSGETITERYAAGEIMADINGAMWLDPQFWREMLDRDRNLFRRVAYLFMEKMSKAVESLAGTRFNVTALVTDVNAVRKLIAQTWADRNQQGDTRQADANGLAFSRGNISSMREFNNSAGDFNPDLDPYWLKQAQKEINGDSLSDEEYNVAVAEYANQYRIDQALEGRGWKQRGLSNVSSSRYYVKNSEEDATGEYKTYEIRVSDHEDRYPADDTIERREHINFRYEPINDTYQITPDATRAELNDILDNVESSFNSSAADDGQPAFSRAEDTILVDGVERPTMNSDGKPIAYTKPILENFWRWFENSRVTDDQGRPLVVYHGAGADFDVFDRSKAGDGPGASLGFFFATDKEFAQQYAKRHNRMRLVEAYLSIKNPRVLTTDDISHLQRERQVEDLRADMASQEQDGGHNAHNGVWIALEPAQIKSATGNQGTFDPSNPDIRFSRKERTEADHALKALSEIDPLFKFPKSKEKEVDGIAHDNIPGVQVRKLTNIPGETRFNFTFPDGQTARMMVRHFNPYGNTIYGYDMVDGEMTAQVDERPGRNAEAVDGKDDVFIDVSLLKEGSGYGARMYNIAATYAYNNGKVFIGDPNGLSDEALRRRPEQMLSSALKFGTTRHLAPHPRQIKGDKDLGVPGLDWVYGDDIGNIEKLIHVNLANIENAGGNGDIVYNKETGEFEDGNGNAISRDDFRGMADDFNVGRAAGAGGTTLARHALFKSFVQGESGRGRSTDGRSNGVLESLLEQLRQHDPADRQGTFNRLFYSRKDAVKTVWDSPEPSKFRDDFIHVMQDKHIDTKRVVQAIRKAAGEINDHWNPYLQEELFHGRSAKQVGDFLGSELRPLLQDMQARGIPMQDFEEYLHMRHAEERNNQIAKVNPDMPDGGSGVDTADARAYLAGLADNKKRAYESLAKRVDAINKATRRILIDSGLEKPETIKAWESAYQYYVPLQREEGGSGIGQGFSVRGSASKRAMGSKRAVVNILANLAMQRERTIVRAEKNRVSTALYGLAITAPNPDFWQPVNPDKIDASKQAELVKLGLNPLDVQNLIDEPKQQYIDQRTGLVAERVNPFLRTAPSVMSTRVNGEDRYVFFNENDERAVRMVRTLKNLDADQLGRILSMLAKVTRYFSSINTQYNPIFGIINLLRDSQEGMFNLSTTPIAGKQKQVMAYTVSALRGIYIDLRDHRAGKETNSKWAAEFEEFQKEGGQTGYRNMFSNSQERADALKKELKAISEGKLKAAGRAIFDWLSDYNETMENAVRLSAYKVAKEQGLSKQQAASIAKNISVNFNRKGMIATQAGALYAFFNAAVQGTARMAETLRGPAGKKIIAGGLLLGSMQALMLAAAGFSDDEPPEFIKSRNLVIPIGDGKYLTWPMPLGLKILPTIGRLMTEFALGGLKNPGKKLASLLDAFADTFNPIGNAGLSIQTLSPTALDPLVALSENRDWTGKPIARVDRSGLAPTPGYTRAKDTASEVSKALSYWINIASGGTKYKPGIVSPTPDQLDYLIGQATGGVGREAMKAEQTVMSQITGEDLPAYKIPLAGRFYGNTKEPASVSGKFYENLRELNLHEAEIKGLRKDKGDVAAYVRENPEAMLVQAANNVDRDIQKLNHKKREMVKHGASKDAIKLVEKQANNRMAQFNDRVRSFVEKQKEKQAN